MLRSFTHNIFSFFFFFFLSGLGGFQNAFPQTHPTIPNADQIVLSTTVTDKKGQLIKGLQRENFRVSIDKKPAEILGIRAEDGPLSVGIVVDVSGSVGLLSSTKEKEAFINSLRQGLRTFLETSNHNNEYFLVGFNQRPQLLLDWTSDFKAIDNKLHFLRPQGNTALYDACYLAPDKVRHGRNPKRLLLLITDGEDNVSNYSFRDIREELKTSDVLLYAVGIGNRTLDGSALGVEGQRILEELTSISGGISYYQAGIKPLTVSDATKIFDGIASELRQQYNIFLAPPVTFDNSKWHKIKVQVESTDSVPLRGKTLLVRTREGFYLNHR